MEILLAEMRQAFLADAKLGTAIVNPVRIALRLVSDGFSPAAARWLVREGMISACVYEIGTNKKSPAAKQRPGSSK